MAFKDFLKGAATAAYNSANNMAMKHQEELSRYTSRYSNMNREQLKREFEMHRLDILNNSARRMAFTQAFEREGIHLVQR